MVELKNNFSGGMDMDSSLYTVAGNAYLNAYNLKRVSSQSNSDLSFTNIVGNRKINYTLPTGTNICIGSKENTERNTALYCIYNSNNFHLVLEFNTINRTIVPILSNLTDTAGVDILGFTAANKITSINILKRLEGDVLSFIDSMDRPTEINITRFKAGQYSPVTRDVIDVARKPSLVAMTAAYSNDTTRRSNQLSKKLFRFRFRYRYDDFQVSVGSPISEIPLPAQATNDVFNTVITNNNVILLNFFAGAINVSKIELLMSYVEGTNDWSDFHLVDSLDNKIYTEGAAVAYSFYNDSTYPFVSRPESIQQFDYVPDKAKCQELVNGNVYVYGNITEGQNRDLVPNVTLSVNTVAAGSGVSTGSLSATYIFGRETNHFVEYSLLFLGNPIIGTVITLTHRNLHTNLVEVKAVYTVIAGNDSGAVVTGIRNAFYASSNIGSAAANGNRLFVTTSDSSGQYKRIFESLTIVPPAVSNFPESIATFPFSESRRIAIRYRDKWGKTNDVLYNDKVTFPAYAEDTSGAVLLPYINAKINHIPPIWAYSYDWMMTKLNTFYIYWYSVKVLGEPKFLYFDITNFNLNAGTSITTSKVLSYSFIEGDRMRLIRKLSGGVPFDDTFDALVEGLVVDPTISSTTQKGTYLKVRRAGALDAVNYSSNDFVIKIYRPQQQLANSEKQVFYEFGQSYKIINPEQPTRVHAGMVTDQNTGTSTPAEFNFYKGDSYFRVRTIPTTGIGAATIKVQDLNFVDYRISAVNNIDGRPGVIDLNAKRANYPTMVRFSEAYQPHTNINALNRFYELNYEEYDLSYGGVVRMKVRDRFMRVFQKYKTGTVPLFSEIRKNSQGGNINVVTDKLLNPIGYLAGNYGIGDCPESLATFSFSDYFTDNIHGAICRVSNDGIQPISILYKANTFAGKELPIRGAQYKIYGVCEPTKQDNYIIAMEATNTSAAKTLSFSEDTNSFEDFLAYQPEMMLAIGTLLISFKNGDLYTHDSTVYNNFYGVQYESYVDMVFNMQSAAKKQPINITEVGSGVWDCPTIETSTISYGAVKQQSELKTVDFDNFEGEFKAALLRDSNSIKGLLDGDTLKGEYIKIRFRAANTTNLVSLNTLSLEWKSSSNNPS